MVDVELALSLTTLLAGVPIALEYPFPYRSPPFATTTLPRVRHQWNPFAKR